MKDKIIVMGLGKLFRKYQKEIYERYAVAGVTSNNAKEAELFSDYIPLSQINHINYEYILICCSAEIEIINQLTVEMGIKKEKILLASVIFRRGMFYSQCNEDAIVFLLLKLIGLKCNEVTYLDLGANHPVNLSNTYSLYLLGASGVLVEPNRELKNIIELVRPRDVLINKAVSLDGKPAEFYTLNAAELGTLCYEKLDNEYCRQYENFDLKETYLVETVTINDIFAGMKKVPDVFSIDIEGYDYLVLNQINFEIYRPSIIIAEIAAWGVKEQDGARIKELFSRNGYKLFCENGINAVFIDKKYIDLLKEYNL